MEKTTVLVTGATGFIGSHIVRLLLEHGESKVVASNASGSTRNLEDVLDQVDIRRADLANFSNVLRLSPTAQELVDAVKAKMPWAKLNFQVNEKISKMIESVTARLF